MDARGLVEGTQWNLQHNVRLSLLGTVDKIALSYESAPF